MSLDLEYFEKIIARQSLIDSSYLTSIADHVKPEFFEDKRIAKYFEIVKDFYERRSALPTISEVKTYLTDDSLKEGFRQLVTSFKEIDKNLNKDELYENTERFLKEKSVYNTLLKVASELSEGIVDTSKILTQFETSCNINLISDKGMELFCDADLLIEDILNVESCISSGWEWLDDALGGGYRENGKGLYVYAGQANIGKSIFLGNAAINIAKQNKSVLVVTLEMSEMLYAKRMSSNLTGVPLKDFESATDSLKRLLSKRKKEIPNGKIFIKEFPPSTITPKQLSSFVKKFKDSGEKVDAIVIDYINLLHSTIGTNSYERVKYICEQVRAMSYEFACPIISATQLNRSAYNTNNPGMEGLSECIEVNQLVELRSGEKIKIGDLKFGQQIKSNDGYKTVTQTHHKKIKKCFKIKLKSGKEIIVSEKHKFPTNRGRISINDGLGIGDKLNILTSPVAATPSTKYYKWIQYIKDNGVKIYQTLINVLKNGLNRKNGNHF